MKQVLFLGIFAAVALTAVYTVITVYDNSMKVGRLHQTPVVRPHEEPALVMDKRTISFDQSERLTRESIEDMVSHAFDGDHDAFLVKGEKDYMAFCSHCHGDRLDGFGSVGQSFYPLPMNLTGKKAMALSDGEMFTAISYGSEKTPALASSMTVESRFAVIKYIRSKQAKIQ